MLDKTYEFVFLVRLRLRIADLSFIFIFYAKTSVWYALII